MHAAAYVDPFFSAYHKKDKFSPSCLVCYTPLQNQLKENISYKDEDYSNPIFTENPDLDKQRDLFAMPSSTQ